MSDRQEVYNRIMVEGVPYKVRLIHNPTIDDVVTTEMQLIAIEVETGEREEGHRVDRQVRDFLIRIGVER